MILSIVHRHVLVISFCSLLPCSSSGCSFLRWFVVVTTMATAKRDLYFERYIVPPIGWLLLLLFLISINRSAWRTSKKKPTATPTKRLRLELGLVGIGGRRSHCSVQEEGRRAHGYEGEQKRTPWSIRFDFDVGLLLLWRNGNRTVTTARAPQLFMTTRQRYPSSIRFHGTNPHMVGLIASSSVQFCAGWGVSFSQINGVTPPNVYEPARQFKPAVAMDTKFASILRRSSSVCFPLSQWSLIHLMGRLPFSFIPDRATHRQPPLVVDLPSFAVVFSEQIGPAATTTTSVKNQTAPPNGENRPAGAPSTAVHETWGISGSLSRCCCCCLDNWQSITPSFYFTGLLVRRSTLLTGGQEHLQIYSAAYFTARPYPLFLTQFRVAHLLLLVITDQLPPIKQFPLLLPLCWSTSTLNIIIIIIASSDPARTEDNVNGSRNQGRRSNESIDPTATTGAGARGRRVGPTHCRKVGVGTTHRTTAGCCFCTRTTSERSAPRSGRNNNSK
jgi:hypothetical protein